jgi:cyclic-di-AMP phosphodiesterase PgpH
MALLKRDLARRRTRRFDLEAASRGTARSRLSTAFSRERLVDSLIAIVATALEVLIVVAGAPAVDEVRVAGVAVLIAGMNVAFALYVAEHYRDLIDDRRRLIMTQLLTLAAFGVGKVFVLFGWPIFLYPLALFGISLSIAQGQRFGIIWSLFVAAIVGFMKEFPGFDFSVAATLAGGTIMGILILGPRVSRRQKVIRAGLFAGVAYSLLILATDLLLEGRAALVTELTTKPRELLATIAFGFLNGLFTGYFLVEFGLRAIENAFDVVTDLRLQELADLNQPILKKFSIEAPGTFHHSQMVGTLAEVAAEAIGANALLCRVGANFHDLGKMAKPEYYIENVTGGATKHDGLTPTMSTLIIVSHVKDGIEMAEELGLPACVIDCIPEHHGTIAVEYFYNLATKQQKREGGPEVSKDDFRYPGPKPQSKETAILMIADSVEAISRVLSEPNPARIEQMVHDVVIRRLTEGQLDECSITLAELKRVEEAMCRVLMGIFHARIKYPKAATVDRRGEADGDIGGPIAPAIPPSAGVPTPAGGTRINAEDTAARIRVASIAADGPGVPSRPGDLKPGS